jgi:hypothetical protein
VMRGSVDDLRRGIGGRTRGVEFRLIRRHAGGG